jgi:hypothetical protein
MIFEKDLARQLNKTRFPKVVQKHQISTGTIKGGRNNLTNLSVDISSSPFDKSMETLKRGKRNLLATSFDALNRSVDYKSSMLPLVSPKIAFTDHNSSFDGKRSLPTRMLRSLDQGSV